MSATRASVERTGWQVVNIRLQVVADVVVEGGIHVRLGHPALDLHAAPEGLVLALEHPVPAQPVDSATLRGGREPGPRVVRDA